MSPLLNHKDICYGPFAPGQFFIDRLNPETPLVYKATGELNENVLICERWGMQENRFEWRFGPFEFDRGIQIAKTNLERMERVSKLNARHFCEKELRRRDDQWRARYDPNREPIKIVRCSCGVGDNEPRTRHTICCFCRGEYS